MSENNLKVVVMAGGTGGHIFPALAIVKELKKHNADIKWLGSENGMENTLVPKHNIELYTVNAVGLRGKSFAKLLKAPFILTYALFQTIKIFIKLKPDIALGMGGFASGIGGLVAWMLRVPLVIHEQNSIPGTTNKALHKIATKTFQAFADTFKKNATTSGNPVLFTKIKKENDNKKLNLLVLGGSLGAKPINEIITKLNLNINIFHQTGKQNVQIPKNPTSYKKTEFIEDMASAYAWADVVICRAGAMTISELMLSGTPSILIPLPHAIDNHQFYNAKILKDVGAGILIEQKDLNIDLLEKIILSFDKDKIKKMSKNALKLATPNAQKQIADAIFNTIYKK